VSDTVIIVFFCRCYSANRIKEDQKEDHMMNKETLKRALMVVMSLVLVLCIAVGCEQTEKTPDSSDGSGTQASPEKRY
jgi:hypothetical protein